MKELTKSDMDSISDSIYNALNILCKDNSAALLCFELLPKSIKDDILHYGASDTPTRDKIYVWLKEMSNMK